MKSIAWIALILSLAAPAFAEKQSVERTVPLARDGEVSIELIAGSLRVTSWERGEVKITGTIDAEFEELEIEDDGDEVRIEVALIDQGQRKMTLKSAADLEIFVPSAAELGIETISAELVVDGVGGRVRIESVSGAIELRGPMEEVELECISGRVDAEIEGALRSGAFETVAGNIDVRGDLSPRGRLSLESVNGDITLRLPAGTSAEFSVETFSGNIENDFGPQATKTSDFLPSKELNFSIGSGGAEVEISSFNGTVRLIED